MGHSHAICPAIQNTGKHSLQLGPETVKKIGNDMGPIEKIISDTSTAKYRIKRLNEGKEITFHIYL